MQYLFGDCTLETLRDELHRAGEFVPLRPKVFQAQAPYLTHLLDVPEAAEARAPDVERALSEIRFRLVEALHCLGDFTASLIALEQQRAACAQDVCLRARLYFQLGHTYSMLGNQRQSVVSMQEALEAAAQAGDVAQRALGAILQACGDSADATRYFQAALQTFTDIQARFEVARTHLLLAECAQAQERIVATHLQAAYPLFQVLHTPVYIKRTEALARRCGIALDAPETALRVLEPYRYR